MAAPQPPTWLRTAFARRAPVWVRALRTGALVVLSFLGLDHVVLPALPARHLTANETRMLREVFGDAVDYNKVRVHHSAMADRWLHSFDTVAMTRRNMITLERNSCSADYALCDDKPLRTVFLHESVHIWQNQNGLKPLQLKEIFAHYSRMLRGVAYEDTYSYSLEGQRALTSYSVEQQAGIISDYVMYVKDRPISDANRYMLFLNRDITTNPAADYRTGYARVLGPFLRNPAYVRK